MKAGLYHPPDFGGEAGAGVGALAGAEAAAFPVVGPSPSDFFSGHPVSASMALTDNARIAASFLMGASIAHVAQKTQLAPAPWSFTKEKGSRCRD